MSKKINQKREIHIYQIIGIVLLSIYALMIVLPMLWVLISSFKTKLDFRHSPFGWPMRFMWSNYKTAFEELFVEVPDKTMGTRPIYMGEMYIYSFLYAVGSTISALAVKCVASYVTAKYNKHKITKIVYSIVIITMILPIVGALPSQIKVSKSLGVYDSILGVCVMKGSFLGMNFMILYATFKSISWEYAEAAQIDGASHLTIFLKIMLPFAKSTLFALGLLEFIAEWNDYTTPMIYLPSFPTIAYGLFSFQQSSSTVTSSITLHFAACILVMIPTLILYSIFKNKLIGSIALGGIKG